MVQNLFRELNVAFCAFGAGIVGQDGFAETGGFREPDAARDDGGEDLVLEEFAKIAGYLAGQVGALVVHGEQDAFNFEGC